MYYECILSYEVHFLCIICLLTLLIIMVIVMFKFWVFIQLNLSIFFLMNSGFCVMFRKDFPNYVATVKVIFSSIILLNWLLFAYRKPIDFLILVL